MATGSASLWAGGARQERLRRWALPVLMAAACALRLAGLTRESLWFDEAYSVAFARYPVEPASFVRLVGPVYTVFLHYWLLVADSDFWVRLPSALAGVASVYCLYRLGRALWDEQTGLLAAFLLALSPLHLWYSQEARMYALATLLAILSAWCFWCWQQQRRGRLGVAYAAAVGLGLYTHAFTALLVPLYNVWVLVLLLRRELPARFLRGWVAAHLALLALLLPFIYGLLFQQSRGYWGWIDNRYGPPGLRSVLDVLASFTYGARIPLPLPAILAIVLLFGLPALWALRGGPSRLRVDRAALFAACLVAVPVGLALLISQFRNLFVPRYLMPFLPGLLLLTARGLLRLPGRALAVGALACVLLVSLVGLGDAYFRPSKEDWRGAAQVVDAQDAPGDHAFLVDGDIKIPFERYYRGPASLEEVWRKRTEPDVLQGLIDRALEAGQSRLWLISSHVENLALRQTLEADPRLRLAVDVRLLGVDVARFDRVTE